MNQDRRLITLILRYNTIIAGRKRQVTKSRERPTVMTCGVSRRSGLASVLLLVLVLPFGHGFLPPRPRPACSTPRAKQPTTTTEEDGRNRDGTGIEPKPNVVATKTTTESALPVEKPFSVSLIKERPEPKTALAVWNRMWMDPRPADIVIRETLTGRSDSRTVAANSDSDSVGKPTKSIPYCLVSDEFVIDNQHRFQISLFPRGRLAAATSMNGDDNSPATNENENANAKASAYLQYIPECPGDEVDVGWKLRLVNTRTNQSLEIATSGGLPRSNTTWSAAMTFCEEAEAIESCGRAADWGSSGWSSLDVCEALREGCLAAEGSIVVYGNRSGETSFKLRGALGAVLEAVSHSQLFGGGGDDTDTDVKERSFKVGEVIVPMANHPLEEALEDCFVTAGTDYRIMTMAAPGDGRAIFSTNEVPPDQRGDIRLALRPCGWKLQQQVWNQQQQKQKQQQISSSAPKTPYEWPVEVPVGWLSTSAKSRFDASAFLPRLAATFRRDSRAVLLGVALALLPLPGALLGRNYVSVYAIPSASMDPTLIKGDVLLVEKFPGVDGRLRRGEVVLFRPPSALAEIAGSAIRSSSKAGGNPLFVKRVVGLPGDTDIALDPRTGDVTLNGGLAADGPDRNLCADEPLRLIDRFLETGKGTSLDRLGPDDFYVLGDCKAVSIDSRVFGVLPRDKIEGRTLGRIWPPDRVTFRQL